MRSNMLVESDFKSSFLAENEMDKKQTIVNHLESYKVI